MIFKNKALPYSTFIDSLLHVIGAPDVMRNRCHGSWEMSRLVTNKSQTREMAPVILTISE